MKFYTRFKTVFCEVILVGDDNGLCNLHLNTGEGKRHFEISEDWKRNDEFFSKEIRQIKEYFEGKRTSFSIKTNPAGSEFQKRVWQALAEIPYGEVRSYKDIAKTVGNSKACRAVGMANSKNPLPLIIPCHRVIGADGKLTGFAQGLDIKEKLLKLEEKNHG
ncbi:methylated-DNA--[protein]-cysteine S-methyltransferase [Lentisphaerota bacterium ZTH]|nr:methylated-DNA--[protein]-cysteine S-methyltransferase [Lentisphaerota bacterium]WET06556.1 methylated-DNA--[protein]-cysteine S-methyltransferase [Lentisphaerota bacterium ZTH]